MKNVICHVDWQRMLSPPSHEHGSCTPTSRSGWWALRNSGLKQSCTLREQRIEKNRVLALNTPGAAQRDDFKEPRLFPLPRRRKALNLLMWAIWFSLISSNLLMVWLPGFCCKMHIHSEHSLPFSEQFLWTNWDVVFQVCVCMAAQSCPTLLWPHRL